MIEDLKVAQLLTLLDCSGVPQQFEEPLRHCPGPPGIRPRTVMAGLLVAASDHAAAADRARSAG
ncbi:hypothetical protein [Streptomyces sp. NPDC059262]|uniref:hypothetical protein n=1 Tax=Streptomyces sp. NPDC059262 TaxID=3346797 RepID=UPI003694FF0D